MRKLLMLTLVMGLAAAFSQPVFAEDKPDWAQGVDKDAKAATKEAKEKAKKAKGEAKEKAKEEAKRKAEKAKEAAKKKAEKAKKQA